MGEGGDEEIEWTRPTLSPETLSPSYIEFCSFFVVFFPPHLLIGCDRLAKSDASV